MTIIDEITAFKNKCITEHRKEPYYLFLNKEKADILKGTILGLHVAHANFKPCFSLGQEMMKHPGMMGQYDSVYIIETFKETIGTL